jgi:apolipoprotein N-acyltransferase
MALLFPTASIWWLAFVSLVPLLLVVEYSLNTSSCFYLGWLAGAVFYASSLWWMFHFSILPIIIITAGLSFITGWQMVLAKLFFVRLPWWSHALAFAALWTTGDFLKNFGLWIYPSTFLSYSQFRDIVFIQICDITGNYGVTFLIVLINFAIFALLTRRYLRAEKVRIVSAVVVLLALDLAYGAYQMGKEWDGQPFRVAMVQGGLENYTKWDKKFLGKSLEVYTKETYERVKPGSVDAIIYPEVSIPAPIALRNENTIPVELKWIAYNLRTKLLFGSFAFARENPKVAGAAGSVEEKQPELPRPGIDIYWNTGLLLNEWGRLSGVYLKNHPVPYGEVLPLAGVLKFINYPWGGSDFSAGNDLDPLQIGNAQAAMNICFETIFPWITQNQVRGGANLIVAIANNSWFKEKAAVLQNSYCDVFRAVENRRYLVRCATTGVSHVIDPAGRILVTTEPFSAGFIEYNLKLVDDQSFYTANGEVFGWLCFFGFLYACFVVLLQLSRVEWVKYWDEKIP